MEWNARTKTAVTGFYFRLLRDSLNAWGLGLVECCESMLRP